MGKKKRGKIEIIWSVGREGKPETNQQEEINGIKTTNNGCSERLVLPLRFSLFFFVLNLFPLSRGTNEASPTPSPRPLF